MKSRKGLDLNIIVLAVLKFKKGASKKEVEKIAISNDKIGKHVQNKNFKKVIFVPERIINFVMKAHYLIPPTTIMLNNSLINPTKVVLVAPAILSPQASCCHLLLNMTCSLFQL